MKKINKLKQYTNHPFSLVLAAVTWLSALLTAAVVVFLIGYILYHGIPNLSLPGIFAWEYNGENQSMTPAIINTFIMVALTLLLAVPIGVGAAIYLVEYAKKGNKLVKVIRITAETLSGIHVDRRGHYNGDHDLTTDHEDNRRSFDGSSGFVQGR